MQDYGLDGTFGQQLLWICNEPTLPFNEMSELLRNEETYCAPSWSWASRNTGVHWLENSASETEFEVIRSDLEPTCQDATVAVKLGSSITLRGRCRKTPMSPGRFKKEPSKESNKSKPSTIHGRIEFRLDWKPDIDSPEEESRLRKLRFFLTRTTIDPFGCESASGILLLPCNDLQRSVYYRVGVFTHYGSSGWLVDLPESYVIIFRWNLNERPRA